MKRWDIAWQWGKAAVDALRRKMLKRGYLLVRLDDIAGGAPSLEGQDGNIILPDMLHTHPQEGLAFTEVKFKDHCHLYQRGWVKSPSNDGTLREWQHGIDRSNWDAYLEIQKKFGIPGYISLVVWKPGHEADPWPHHLHQSLDNLSQHVRYGQPAGTFAHGSAMFPMGIWRCSAIDFEVPDLPSLVQNLNVWEQKSKAGIAPAWRVEYRDVAPLEPNAPSSSVTRPPLSLSDHCRVCAAFLTWPDPVGVIYADGTAECMRCADSG